MEQQTVLLTTTGDLYLSTTNQMGILTGAAKVAQDLWVILRTVKGSYTIDPTFGVDYPAIIHHKFQESFIRETISKELLKHPDVDSITNFKSIRLTEDRQLLLLIKVLLKSGQTISLSGSV